MIQMKTPPQNNEVSKFAIERTLSFEVSKFAIERILSFYCFGFSVNVKFNANLMLKDSLLEKFLV